MNVDKDIVYNSTAGLSGVDDAVGVEKSQWFIAILNNRSEKATAEKLKNLGIENYLPTQTVFRVWKNGKKTKIVKVVIPAVIFIHCTERERREIVALPFIFRFMTDKARGVTNSGSKPLAIVSDEEINRLKFMLGQSDIPVTITEHSYKKGDRVRVLRGSLAGLEGEVWDLKSSQSELIVCLEHFGCAKLIIDTLNLEVISDSK